MTKLNKGDMATLRDGRLDGLPVEVLRQSPKTGVYTVRVTGTLDAAPAYKVGTELHVSRYEMRDSEPLDMQDEADPAGRIPGVIERAKSET